MGARRRWLGEGVGGRGEEAGEGGRPDAGWGDDVMFLAQDSTTLIPGTLVCFGTPFGGGGGRGLVVWVHSFDMHAHKIKVRIGFAKDSAKDFCDLVFICGLDLGCR